MAYITNNLSLLSQSIEGGRKRWQYITTDSIATVIGAGYFSDADKKRLAIGDIIEVFTGTLQTTGVTEAAAVFPATVGVGSDFLTFPVHAILMVATISSGAATAKGATLLIGAAATDLAGFYGATPIVQPAGAAQAAITDASGGTAAATNGVLTLTGTYNSTILANAIATLAAQGNAMRLALVNLGVIKGAA